MPVYRLLIKGPLLNLCLVNNNQSKKQSFQMGTVYKLCPSYKNSF